MTLPPPITSRSNAKVKALRAALSGKPSQPGDLLGIEGETLLLEALRSGVHVETLFLQHGSEAALSRPELRTLPAARIAVLSPDVFASAVDTASPQGLAALISIPDVLPNSSQSTPPLTLVLESMQDPGNLGTLLRTAEAFGASQIVLTPDTVNPWNPKAVRASAGSVFRVPVTRMKIDEARRCLTSSRTRLFAAVAHADGALSCIDADLAQPCALMIGNEGAGLSVAALAHADHRIHIPCATESLNAAAAGTALLYEAMRQRILKGVASAPGERP